jgi:hypothetical protein
VDKVARKRHCGIQDDSGALEDEVEDGVASGGHHPKHRQQRPVGRERLWKRSWTLHEEIDRIKWQGEQVYNMLARNAIASRVILD